MPTFKACYWVCLLEWIRKLRDKLLFCADVKSPVLSLSFGNCRARVLLPSALSRVIAEYTLEETLSSHVSCCKVLTSNLKRNYQLLSLWVRRFGSTWSTDHTLVPPRSRSDPTTALALLGQQRIFIFNHRSVEESPTYELWIMEAFC